jgi:hypothetical protein
MTSSGLTFGIYPLGVAGTPTGLAVGPQDDYEKIQFALQNLRGKTKKLLPRTYSIYTGPETETRVLAAVDRYLRAGLLGDLTIGCLQESDIVPDGWFDFIRKIIQQFGAHLDSLQITNEPNLSFMDGSKPYVIEALVQGVITAKQEARARNLQFKIGFGSVPNSPVAVPHFWERLAQVGGKEFIESLDYVGHNFYIDVFEEALIDLKDIPVSVERVLRLFRQENLKTAGIPTSIPIRIAENGWPTGKNPLTQIDRPYDQQAKVLETVIRTVYQLREELHISHYELFGLRDADSTKEDLFHQFGIMRDDYTPKPAFYAFQHLIQELGN